MFTNLSSLSSGTETIPTFGSIVQNGKFSMATSFFVKALKSVDFPTFGNPTMPILKDILEKFMKFIYCNKGSYTNF